MVRECQIGNGTFENAKDIEAKSSDVIWSLMMMVVIISFHIFDMHTYLYHIHWLELEGSPGSLAGGLILTLSIVVVCGNSGFWAYTTNIGVIKCTSLPYLGGRRPTEDKARQVKYFCHFRTPLYPYRRS